MVFGTEFLTKNILVKHVVGTPVHGDHETQIMIDEHVIRTGGRASCQSRVSDGHNLWHLRRVGRCSTMVSWLELGLEPRSCLGILPTVI